MMQTFSTPTPVTVALDIPVGRVRFIAADRADTTVEVLPADAAKGRDVKMAEQITVEFSEGVLQVQAPAANRVLGNSGAVEVTVQLPAGSRLEAKAASAELRTVGRLGDVVFEGSQATIKIDEAASAHLDLHDGGVQVGRLGGDGQIRTQRGDIQIAEAMAGNLELSTQAGSITVSAAAGVSASLDASTSYGRISNSLKNTGTATLTIHATTSHGDITARSL
jgi:DUF4097 and DUF4098 domain-containing protein YvlB